MVVKNNEQVQSGKDDKNTQGELPDSIGPHKLRGKVAQNQKKSRKPDLRNEQWYIFYLTSTT
jgi:hypothetical protein